VKKGADIITIFPGFFDAADYGVLGQAAKDGLYEVRARDLRDFTTDRHRSTDDTPFGGGAGMVMLAGPVFRAVEAVDQAHSSYRILLTPRGEPFSQKTAADLALKERLLILCGRYEGFDERIASLFDAEVSAGDFVLSGGEPAALAIVDAVARLVPGVLGNERSIVDESFAAGMLEYPQYTRPREICGQKVPEVLFTGDHAAISRWRRGMALSLTRKRRPDLFARLKLSEGDWELLEEAEAHPGGSAAARRKKR
jgi:tRNA (guanine37-N1)-methyltransferase